MLQTSTNIAKVLAVNFTMLPVVYHVNLTRFMTSRKKKNNQYANLKIPITDCTS